MLLSRNLPLSIHEFCANTVPVPLLFLPNFISIRSAIHSPFANSVATETASYIFDKKCIPPDSRFMFSAAAKKKLIFSPLC